RALPRAVAPLHRGAAAQARLAVLLVGGHGTDCMRPGGHRDPCGSRVCTSYTRARTPTQGGDAVPPPSLPTIREKVARICADFVPILRATSGLPSGDDVLVRDREDVVEDRYALLELLACDRERRAD